jgi:hypothetical protein
VTTRRWRNATHLRQVARPNATPIHFLHLDIDNLPEATDDNTADRATFAIGDRGRFDRQGAIRLPMDCQRAKKRARAFYSKPLIIVGTSLNNGTAVDVSAETLMIAWAIKMHLSVVLGGSGRTFKGRAIGRLQL